MEATKESLRSFTHSVRKIRFINKKRHIAMRTKHFIVILGGIIVTTLLFMFLGPAGEPNDSLKSIVSQTHEQFSKLQVSNAN